MQHERLRRFLVKAKRNTYASGNNTVKLDDGSEEFVYENGIYKYRDRYFGNDPFIGQEVVFENQVPIWGMNYVGGISDPNVDSGRLYEFLRQALKRVNEQEPFRGPDWYDNGEFTYWNSVIGQESNFFIGRENISLGFREIYECIYHGGLIKK